MEEYGDEVFNKLSKGAHIYFCGLKGMMPGILNMLEKVAKKKKLNWETTLKDLKKKGKSTVVHSNVSQKRSFSSAGRVRLNRTSRRSENDPQEASWCHEMA